MGSLSLTTLKLGLSQPGKVPWRWLWGGGTALCQPARSVPPRMLIEESKRGACPPSGTGLLGSVKSRRLVLGFQKVEMRQYMWEEQLGAGEVGDSFSRCLQHGGSGFPVGLGQGRMLPIHQRLQFNIAQKTQGIKGM